MTAKESFGEHIRMLREQKGLPLRKVAAALDIDTSTLSKIERGERSANKEVLPLLADLFKEDKETLGLILLSDKIAYDLLEEENPNEILKIAEKKILKDNYNFSDSDIVLANSIWNKLSNRRLNRGK